MDIIISNSTDEPIYEQIERQIRRQIVAGILKEGELLPSIRRLASELLISVITTKRAYEDLEREGFLETVVGRGTYVAAQRPGFLLEKKRKACEELLAEAVRQARAFGLPDDDVTAMLELLMEDES